MKYNIIFLLIGHHDELTPFFRCQRVELGAPTNPVELGAADLCQANMGLPQTETADLI
jgi:hypothetical protein